VDSCGPKVVAESKKATACFAIETPVWPERARNLLHSALGQDAEILKSFGCQGEPGHWKNFFHQHCLLHSCHQTFSKETDWTTTIVSLWKNWDIHDTLVKAITILCCLPKGRHRHYTWTCLKLFCLPPPTHLPPDSLLGVWLHYYNRFFLKNWDTHDTLAKAITILCRLLKGRRRHYTWTTTIVSFWKNWDTHDTLVKAITILCCLLKGKHRHYKMATARERAEEQAYQLALADIHGPTCAWRQRLTFWFITFSPLCEST